MSKDYEALSDFEKMEFLLRPSTGGEVAARILRSLPDYFSKDAKAGWLTGAIEYVSEHWGLLSDLNVNSVLNAICACACTGLSLAPKDGKAYLVPFKRECQFMPSYHGLKELACRSEAVSNIVEKPVFESDTFEIQDGSHPRIHHVPDITIDRDMPDGLIGCYAIAYMKEGPDFIHFMTMPQLERRAEMSKSGAQKVRGKWPVAMHCKAPVRFLATRVPSNPQLDLALAAVKSSETRQEQEGVQAQVTVKEQAADVLPSAEEVKSLEDTQITPEDDPDWFGDADGIDDAETRAEAITG